MTTLIVPNLWFLTHLYTASALPTGIYKLYPGWGISDRLLWLGIRKGYPMFNGQGFSFSFNKHDSLPKVLGYFMTWLMLIIAQIGFILGYVMWIGT